MTESQGATPFQWGHFEFVLGLAGHLLPVVCNPDATPAPGTKIKKFGKTPSAYNRDNLAHGLKDWTTRPILANEVALWRQDPRLGICVRTGSISGVYAIDVDVTDPELALAIQHQLPTSNVRVRDNSSKFLFLFEIVGRPPLTKRILTTPAGRVELLADGQQCLLVGMHQSGVPYRWAGGLPSALLELDQDGLERIWRSIASLPECAAPAPSGAVTGRETVETLTRISDEEVGQLADALAHSKMLEDAVDNDFWSEIGYGLLSLGEEGWQLFDQFSRIAPKYEPGKPEEWWEAHRDQTPRSDYRHIFALARKRGWGAKAPTDAFEPLPPENPPNDPLDVEKRPARPVLLLKPGELYEQVEKVAEVISDEIYKQGQGLVRIGRASDIEDSMKRDSTQRSLVRLSSAYLRCQIERRMTLMKFDGRAKDYVKCSCPRDLAEVIIDQRDWPTIRPLDSIVRAPFVRTDGTVCDVPGYDPESHAYYLPSAQFPPLAPAVSKADAEAALATLIEPFAEFPYETQGGKAAFVAHILTEAASPALDRSPMFWYSASYQGTGKSLLCDMASTIVHGVTPARRPWISDKEELRKTLFSSLLAGDRSITFDNVPEGTKIRSDILSMFVTSDVYEDRRLGASEIIKINNRAVVSASGNNITPVKDIARRSLVVRLNARTKNLKSRVFRIESLESYVKAHRVELLMSALTVIRGWQQNRGVEKMPVPLPSFEQWSRTVRDALIWLGMTNPVETQEEETDDEGSNLDKAFDILGDFFQGREFAASEIPTVLFGAGDTDGAVTQVLKDAGCLEPFDAAKVGYWLRGNRDRYGGKYTLARGKVTHGSAKWVFKLAGSNEDLA